MRLLQVAMILIALLCSAAAAVKPLLAQQARDSATVAAAHPARATATNTHPVGPRLAPPFQRVDPRLTNKNEAGSASLGIEGGQHVIVVSTLALVLAAIIVLLLVT